MKSVIAAISMVLLLTGCVTLEVKEGAIKPEIRTAPDTVHIESPINPTIELAPKMTKALDFRPQFKIPKGMVSIRTAPITFRPVVEMKEGAIKPVFTVIVPKDALNINVVVPENAIVIKPSVVVAEGAIQVKGATLAEGAIQGPPTWAWITMAVLGLGWVITKFRRHDASRSLENKTRSLLDVPF